MGALKTSLKILGVLLVIATIALGLKMWYDGRRSGDPEPQTVDAEPRSEIAVD